MAVQTVLRRRQAQVKGGLARAVRTAEERERRLEKLASSMSLRRVTAKRGSGQGGY